MQTLFDKVQRYVLEEIKTDDSSQGLPLRRRKTKWKILCQTSNFCLGETNVEICWDPTTLQLRNTWCSDDLFPFTISNGKELLLKMKEDNEKKGEERRFKSMRGHHWRFGAMKAQQI